MMKWFPIETERLLLREFVSTDEADIHEYASDAEAIRYVWWGPNTPEKTQEILLARLDEQKLWPRADVTLGIELKSGRKLIGSIRIGVADRDNRTGDFGYVLNRRYWNNGYTTEAAGALVSRAFSALGLHRICATCDTRNIASARVLEKIGMRREGHFIRDVFQRGQWRDSYLYALLADDVI